MTKLRVLGIDDTQMQCEVHISDDFKFHFDELRCLFWEHFPLKLLPSDFKCKNLLFLCMPNSHLTQLWEGNKVFENLKYMDLADSKYLTEAPDFSRVTNLKYLCVDGCTQLCKIHPSLGDLDKLTCLTLENCINLEHFPGIGQLVSLKTLILSGCSKLKKFPDISQHMPCLRKLCLDGTAITELPSSIGYATELVRLDLKNCGKLRSLPSSICELTLLQTLSLSGCSDLGKCEVNSGNVDALPRTLDRLCSLQELVLQNCRSLRALPALPSSLRIINASNCESLEDITPRSVFSQVRSSMFGNCLKLTKFQSRMERDLQSMAARVDEEVRRPTFEEQNPEIPVLFSTVFPGSGIPDWFEHRSEGHEINIQVSQNWYARNFLGFALSAVVAPEKESLTSGWITYCDLGCGALDSKLKSNGIFSFSFFDVFTKHLEHITIGSDHMWLAYEPSFLGFAEKWSCIKFSFRTDRESCIVKCCGVCPVYAKSNSDDESNSDGDYSYSDNESNSDGDYSYSDDEYKSDTCYSYSDDGDYSYSDNESNSDGVYSYSDDEYKSDTYYSYGDEGNPSGRDLDDLHEWRLEDNTIERSPKEAQSRGSVQENVNDSMLQDTIIRSLDDAEPRGIGYSCTNAHACAMIRRSLHEVLEDIQQSESQEIGCFHTDSRRWDQERFERQPNPSISNIEIRIWVFIIIFSFLLLVRIFYWAPVQIPTLLDAPFWISPLVAAPFGTSTLVAAPFGISSLLPVPFEISTLLGGPLGISILLGGVELLLFILSRQ